MKIFRLALLIALAFCSQLLFAQIRAKNGRGYFNITNIAEVQYIHSLDSSSLKYASAHIKGISFGFSTINGVFLNRNLSVGLGIGMQFTGYKARPTSFTPDSSFAEGYFEDRHSLSLLPVFADFRYYPNGSQNGLMLLLDVGYAPLLKIANDFDKVSLDGGPMVKLGAAYRIPISETLSILPSFNFNAQRFGDNTTLGANIGAGFMF